MSVKVKWTRYKICQSQNQQRKLKISIHQIFCPWSPCKETVHYLGRCSCFVSCIPSLVLPDVDIIFAVLSVICIFTSLKTATKKHKVLRSQPQQKGKSSVFCSSNSARGGTLIFMGSIYILVSRNGIRQDEDHHHDQKSIGIASNFLQPPSLFAR